MLLDVTVGVLLGNLREPGTGYIESARGASKVRCRSQPELAGRESAYASPRLRVSTSASARTVWLDFTKPVARKP